MIETKTCIAAAEIDSRGFACGDGAVMGDIQGRRTALGWMRVECFSYLEKKQKKKGNCKRDAPNIAIIRAVAARVPQGGVGGEDVLV